MNKPRAGAPAKPNIFSILQPYRGRIILLTAVTLVANALTLWLPKIISHAIDAFAKREVALADVAWQFGLVTAGIFIFTFAQYMVQVVTSEVVARDLRNTLAAKISRQSFMFVQQATSAKLLTNLTSDIDAVKTFVAQAIASLISSIVLIVGAAILLLTTYWQLAVPVLLIVPLIGITFSLTLQRVRVLFVASRDIIDKLNRVINESILGAALVRVVNSTQYEQGKFTGANAEAKNLGLRIVAVFAGLIPAITFLASSATLVILVLGGHYVISGGLSLGDFAAFTTYLAILIFPIIVIGFIGNLIAQASASYERIAEVLNAPELAATGNRIDELTGAIEVKNVTVAYGEKRALKSASLKIAPKTRTAIIGPTAAGKSQLLYVMTGLVPPTEGSITYDGHPLLEFDPERLHQQLGLVFQDSIVFNMSIRENIAFSGEVSEVDLARAIQTAELDDFIATLDHGLDTRVSERGTSLSGGQKQRLMLARALALNPKILYLDDFTARVDTATEAKILQNLRTNYPDLTLISVTQKIGAVEDYDQIIVVMEGEILATGTHKQLLETSSDYLQIYRSQQSTNSYEVHA